ncbi:hypothetical protein GCM10027418_06460 [Mariniluteicoccus endophyticus]
MTDYVWTSPTARIRHRCMMCRRVILPGEPYQRMAGLDRGEAWTYKACDHCYRVASAWSRLHWEDEWDDEAVFEWLEEDDPALWVSMRAGWRYPDGELLPLPFQPRCQEGEVAR